jgi:sec-independent protein translocase protein TatB
MFDIGWSELVVVGIVALIVIGPRELPATLRTIGQMLTKVRRMASEFQGQFQDAIREAELDEIRKEAEKLTSDMTSAASYNPLEKTASEIQAAIDAPVKTDPAPAPASTSPESAPATETLPEPKPAEAAADSAPSGGRAA